jgi:hypothetical protein
VARNALVALAQQKLDEARRALHGAVEDFNIPDDEVLELRKNAQRAFEELKEFDRQAAKKGLLGVFGL